MRIAILLSIMVLFAGCATEPMNSESESGNSSRSVRYDCYTYVGSKHVLTLPVPEPDNELGYVLITFHGDEIGAFYQRNGLTQIWSLDDGLYMQVDPDLVGRYMDFRGAEPGERRKSQCRV